MEPPVAQHYGVLPVQRVVAESECALVVLTAVHAYCEGCVIDYRAAARRSAGSEHRHDRAELHDIFDPQVPEATVNFRVDLPDGTGSTIRDTIALRYQAYDAPGTSPTPPALVPLIGSGGVSNAHVLEVHQPLWLWPLPPPEQFTMTVDWPAYGITGATHHLDGAAIVDAAKAARDYWPDQ